MTGLDDSMPPTHDAHAEAEAEARGSFWTNYQPGLRASSAVPGTAEFYAEVEAQRYALEHAIPNLVDFPSWEGREVLEAGCGIGTDAMRFARAGAKYTGVDLSPTALELAGRRFKHEGLPNARALRASVTDLPFEDASFDLVYSNGVIHHLPETQMAVEEFHRVLRPGGTALVMVYHRNSLNFFFTVMLLRRLLASAVLLPGSDVLGRLSGEPPEVIEGHRRLLRELGPRYLTDPEIFLSHNTDGPGNPLSKAYTRKGIAPLFCRFESIETHVRFLNLRLYPGGNRFARSALGRRVGRALGWHLWIRARKRQ